jgi:hypothetical protein
VILAALKKKETEVNYEYFLACTELFFVSFRETGDNTDAFKMADKLIERAK